MRFYLIAKNGEARLTPFITETALANHKAQGWTVIRSWASKPTERVVHEAAFLLRVLDTPQPTL